MNDHTPLKKNHQQHITDFIIQQLQVRQTGPHNLKKNQLIHVEVGLKEKLYGYYLKAQKYGSCHHHIKKLFCHKCWLRRGLKVARKVVVLKNKITKNHLIL